MSWRDNLRAGVPLRFTPGTPDQQRTVEAAWIEEAARGAKAVHLEHGLIRGALNLKYASVEKEFRLQDCEIQDRADFSYSAFKQMADFSGSVFKVGPDFHNSRFEYELLLTSAKFLCGEGCWSHVTVSRTLQAEDVKFEDTADANFDNLSCGSAVFNRAVFGGQVSFRNAYIQGEARFSGASFHKAATFVWAHVKGPTTFGTDEQGLHAAEFHAEADFRDAALTGDADFEGVIFSQGDALFTSVRFGGTAVFKGANFKAQGKFDGVRVGEELNFEGAKFESLTAEAVFDKAEVSGSLFFANSRFAGEAKFEGMKVEGTAAQFLNAEFSRPVTFVNADFRGSVEFKGAKFHDGSAPNFGGVHFSRGCYFQNSQFHDEAHFQAVQFDDEAFFQGVRFHKRARFEASHFSGMVRFDAQGANLGTSFTEQVCFDHAKFDRDARFDDTVFERGASLREASFRVIYLAPNGRVGNAEQFQGAVNLTGCTYDRIQVDWRRLLGRLSPQDRQPYMQLEKTLRGLGQDKAADDVYLERKRVEGDRLTPQQDNVRWLLDRIYRCGANYGVRPIRLAVFALAMIGLGGMVFRCPQAVRAKDKSVCPIAEDKRLACPDSMRFSLRTFLPVDIPLLPGCEATENRALGLKYSDWATMLRLAGWILVPIGVASLAGLLRRVAP